MPEELTGTTADLKKAWSHELTDALRRDVIVSLTGSPAHSPMLMSRYTEILGLAESRFGPRDASYTILGIEFIAGGPQIRYFGQGKSIIIQLSRACLHEPDRACYQLAHETIHLLSPTTSEEVSVLEEGLATHFQRSYMIHHYPSGWPLLRTDWAHLPPESARYERARRLVRDMLEIDAAAVSRLRATTPHISRIAAAEIRAVCPTLPSSVTTDLATRFAKF